MSGVTTKPSFFPQVYFGRVVFLCQNGSSCKKEKNHVSLISQ